MNCAGIRMNGKVNRPNTPVIVGKAVTTLYKGVGILLSIAGGLRLEGSFIGSAIYDNRKWLLPDDSYIQCRIVVVQKFLPRLLQTLQEVVTFLPNFHRALFGRMHCDNQILED